jgi:hypothetical protein
MTDAELLQHYIQCKRIIDATQRSPGHHRLKKLGFIDEHPVGIKNLLITVTAGGRTAIGSRPTEYVGTHPTELSPNFGDGRAGQAAAVLG